MKKALIITYYWPPTGGSGVQRWLKFTKYMPKYGWEPIIYTPSNPCSESIDNKLDKDIRPETIVLKTPIVEPYSVYKFFTGQKRDAKIGSGVIANANDDSLTKRIGRWIRGNLFIPDARFLWIKPSVEYLTHWLKENHVDVIISTGPPHSMHLIAKQVSMNTGIKWVADFRDPWTGMFYFKHLMLTKRSLEKHRKLEQNVLDKADRIIVVSKRMLDEFNLKTRTRIEIITNGYDKDDFRTSANPAQLKAKDFFEITHTGLMVENGNPTTLWQILAEMAGRDTEFAKNLHIRLIGRSDASIIEYIKSLGLESNLIDMGYISHNEIPGWQRCSSLLILPLRKEPEAEAILTGKVFEYMAACVDKTGIHPEIAGFGPVHGDLSIMLKDAGCGAVYDWDDKERIRTAIQQAYSRFMQRTGSLSGVLTAIFPDMKATAVVQPTLFDGMENGSPVVNSVEKYSRENLTEHLAALLDDVIDMSKPKKSKAPGPRRTYFK